MSPKVRAGLAVFAVCLLAAPIKIAVAETTTTPAPPGQSEAVAAKVGTVIAVGYTKATANSNSGEATANALELQGKPLSAGTGGTQKGKGKSSGATYDSKDTPLGRLMLTPWSAEVKEDSSGRSSESDAALLKLILINSGTASVQVLHTNSKARHNDDKSTANTSSDGARANVGGDRGLTVILLHSETSSDGKGNRSYVASVNGATIMSSDQAGKSCAINVPNVVTLGCLNASGGKGSSSASVADGNLGGATGPRVAISSGSSKFGEGASVLGTTFTRPEDNAAAIDETARGSGLAVSGGDLAKGFATALALMALGTALVALRRAWPVTV